MLTSEEYSEQSLEFDFDEIDVNIRSKVQERAENIVDFSPKGAYVLLSFDTLEEDRKTNRVVILADTYDFLKTSLKDKDWDQSELTFIENIECTIYDKSGKVSHSKRFDIEEQDSEDEDEESSVYDVVMSNLKSLEKHLSKLNKEWMNDSEFYLYNYGQIFTISKGFNYVDRLIENSGKNYWEQDGVVIDPFSKDFPYERSIDMDVTDLATELKTTNDPGKIKDILKKFMENH